MTVGVAIGSDGGCGSDGVETGTDGVDTGRWTGALATVEVTGSVGAADVEAVSVETG